MAVTKPTDLPEWATSATAHIDEPPSAKKQEGWVSGEHPPAEWFNWWQEIVYDWCNFLDGYLSTPGANQLTITATSGLVLGSSTSVLVSSAGTIDLLSTAGMTLTSSASSITADASSVTCDLTGSLTVTSANGTSGLIVEYSGKANGSSAYLIEDGSGRYVLRSSNATDGDLQVGDTSRRVDLFAADSDIDTSSAGTFENRDSKSVSARVSVHGASMTGSAIHSTGNISVSATASSVFFPLHIPAAATLDSATLYYTTAGFTGTVNMDANSLSFSTRVTSTSSSVTDALTADTGTKTLIDASINESITIGNEALSLEVYLTGAITGSIKVEGIKYTYTLDAGQDLLEDITY